MSSIRPASSVGKCRRGFYTAWDVVDMLRIAVALTRTETGRLRQNPHLADPHLIRQRDIAAVCANWAGACKQTSNIVSPPDREVECDLFESIMIVLTTDSPVGEHRKIPEEILRRIRD